MNLELRLLIQKELLNHMRGTLTILEIDLMQPQKLYLMMLRKEQEVVKKQLLQLRKQLERNNQKLNLKKAKVTIKMEMNHLMELQESLL